MTQDRPAKLLKPVEVAQMLGVHRATVLHWLQDGVLPGIRLPGNAGWRIDAAKLDAWLAEHEHPQAEPENKE